MTLVIAVVALKGGVGKSTICLNMGAALHRAKHRTLLVDADSQGTLRAWAARGADSKYDGPPVIGLDGRTLRRDLQRVADGFEIAIVDAPPRLGAEARAAMIEADMVLMPVTPGAADVWALQETLTVLEDARSMRPEIKASVVMNRTDRTNLSTTAKAALGELPVPILVTTLGSRVAFGEATLAGEAVVDYAPESQAAEEIRELVKEVLASIGGKSDGKKGRSAGRRVQATNSGPTRTGH